MLFLLSSRGTFLSLLSLPLETFRPVSQLLVSDALTRNCYQIAADSLKWFSLVHALPWQPQSSYVPAHHRQDGSWLTGMRLLLCFSWEENTAFSLATYPRLWWQESSTGLCNHIHSTRELRRNSGRQWIEDCTVLWVWRPNCYLRSKDSKQQDSKQ